MTLRAPAGHRTFVTDAFRVRAMGCSQNFNVRLTAVPTNSFGQAATTGNWADKGMQVYLSTASGAITSLTAAAGTSPAGNDFSNATVWNTTPLVVQPGGTVSTASTGTVTLADATELVVGVVIDGQATAGAVGTFHFQVEFIPV